MLKLKKVAIQGDTGSYSEEAALSMLGREIEIHHCEHFREVFEMTSVGQTSCCVVPIENSLAGSIHKNYDLLLRYKLKIAREINLHIQHNLVGVPGVAFKEISTVVNGILGTPVELGMICVGTGNDIARSLGIPYNNLKASLEVILAGRIKMVDIGMETDRCFVSALGIGLAANIAVRVNKMKRLKGPVAFFVAAYQAIGSLESLPLCLTLDSRTMELECVAVLVQNSCYCGGGLLLAPQASMTDGLLDVVVIEKIGRAELMFNFPRLYQGKHLDHPKFSVHQAKVVNIESSAKTDKMFDGDVFGKTPVRAKIAESPVRMVVS